MSRFGERSLGVVGIGLVVVGSLLPFVLFALASLKTPVEITASPPTLVPSGTLEPYRVAWVEHDFATILGNSLVVAATTTLVAVVLGALAGYALARLPVPGRRLALAVALGATMFPQMVLAGPVWRILRDLGLLNELGGLVLPYVSLALPLAVWLLASFFRELPRDVEEAALVDGASRLAVVARVVAPMAAPAVATTALVVFVFAWNEFFFALLVLSDPAKHTLPVGLALFSGRFTVPWAELAAASVIATLPLVALVLAFQRRIVRGLVAGAVKG